MRSFAEWREALDTLKGVLGTIIFPLEVHDDPQVKANGYLETVVTSSGATLDIPANPVQFDEMPYAVRGAPELGAQTEEICLEMGMSFNEEILDLRAQGCGALS